MKVLIMALLFGASFLKTGRIKTSQANFCYLRFMLLNFALGVITRCFLGLLPDISVQFILLLKNTFGCLFSKLVPLYPLLGPYITLPQRILIQLHNKSLSVFVLFYPVALCPLCNCVCSIPCSSNSTYGDYTPLAVNADFVPSPSLGREFSCKFYHLIKNAPNLKKIKKPCKRKPSRVFAVLNDPCKQGQAKMVEHRNPYVRDIHCDGEGWGWWGQEEKDGCEDRSSLTLLSFVLFFF